MIIWGMSKNGHDWAIAVFKSGNHIQTFSGKGKSHPLTAVHEAKDLGCPSLVIWYENPYLKALRQFISGQPKPFKRNNIKRYLRDLNINCRWDYVGHHESHAAAFYKSGFDNATVVVFDSIGEFDCTSIWKAEHDKLKKIKSTKYPHSIGLFYSAMTDRIGLKPQQDEAVFEQISQAYTPFSQLVTQMENDIIKQWEPMPKFRVNFHHGVRQMWWNKGKKEIASAARIIFESLVTKVLLHAREVTDSHNIVLSGGVAFNKSVPNIAGKIFNNLYIPPNPGDIGSAEGAVLSYLRK